MGLSVLFCQLYRLNGWCYVMDGILNSTVYSNILDQDIRGTWFESHSLHYRNLSLTINLLGVFDAINLRIYR